MVFLSAVSSRFYDGMADFCVPQREINSCFHLAVAGKGVEAGILR